MHLRRTSVCGWEGVRSRPNSKGWMTENDNAKLISWYFESIEQRNSCTKMVTPSILLWRENVTLTSRIMDISVALFLLSHFKLYHMKYLIRAIGWDFFLLCVPPASQGSINKTSYGSENVKKLFVPTKWEWCFAWESICRQLIGKMSFVEWRKSLSRTIRMDVVNRETEL